MEYISIYIISRVQRQSVFIGIHIKYFKVMCFAVQVIMSLSRPASSPLALKYGIHSLSRKAGLKLRYLSLVGWSVLLCS